MNKKTVCACAIALMIGLVMALQACATAQDPAALFGEKTSEQPSQAPLPPRLTATPVHRQQKQPERSPEQLPERLPERSPQQSPVIQAENVNIPPELAVQEPDIDLPVQTPMAEFTQNGDVIALTLLGIDTDPAREKANRGYRSDSIAVLAINTKTKTCTVINVPRDTRTTVQRLDKNGKVISTKKDKINSAYAYGGGADKRSHENALQAISHLLGVDLTYYASIDMDSIVPLANAVGGVPVILEADFPGIGKKGDEVLLKDDKAYTFVRKRKGVTGGSDIGRIDRQQLFIKSLAQKVQSMNPLQAIPKMLATLGGRVRTNLSLPQMLSLGSILKEADVQSIHFTTLPGRGQTINGTSYWIHDSKKTQEIVREAFG